jgi:tRNA G18 (ribose-2'-O)-methylase SpoU
MSTPPQVRRPEQLPQGVVELTEVQDPRMGDYVGLTDVALRSRREGPEGLYMAESAKVIRRALAVGHRPRSMVLATRWLEPHADLVTQVLATGAPVFVADDVLLQQLTGFHLHRGALAAMHRPAPVPFRSLLPGARRLVVLEDVVDHTNVGAIFRSAAGIGADAVLVSPRCADPLYRRSVRVSMGTVFQVPWARIEPWPDGLEVLQRNGFTVAALALTTHSLTLTELADRRLERVALVLGTEGDGLGRQALAAADVTVRIPMAGGVDSLNVAAAVALWALQPG